MTGYVYDAGGNPYWVAGNSTVFDGQFSVDINLLYLEGGAFGPEAGNPVVADDAFGTLNVEFHTCNEATFSFAGIEGVSDFEAEFSHLKTIFGGNSADNCVYQKAFSGCPAGTSAGIVERSCVLEGTYTSDLTLTNDTTWVLSGGVFIGEKSDIGDAVPADGPVLTIEPGTRIVGSGGTGNALYIQRGSKIIAEGLPHAPIVMTGENWEGTGALAQDWGGLVINGAAPINDGIDCQTLPTPPCEAVGEGDSGAYGGDDPLDNSGVLRYVRVQFAGEKINDEDDFTVTGIVEKPPAQSHFVFDMLCSFETLYAGNREMMESWSSNFGYFTYLLLEEKADGAIQPSGAEIIGIEEDRANEVVVARRFGGHRPRLGVELGDRLGEFARLHHLADKPVADRHLGDTAGGAYFVTLFNARVVAQNNRRHAVFL